MKLSLYYKLYRLIENGRLRFYAIRALKALGLRYLVVKFDTNWLCNLRCRMCYFSSEGYSKNSIKPMSVEAFKKIAADVFPRTRLLFLGCGAEPLMSPAFPEYAAIAAGYKIPYVAVVTNGQLLTEEVARSMIENRFNEVIVSVDGATAETYESIRAGAKFDRLIENLTRLRDMKRTHNSTVPFVRFNFTSMKKNIDELPRLIDLASTLDVATIRARSLQEWGGALETETQRLPDEMYVREMERAAAYGKTKHVDVLYEGVYGSPEAAQQHQVAFEPYECLVPWYHVMIRGDGKMRWCSALPFGEDDLSAQRLDEIYASAHMTALRQKLLNDPQHSCLNVCKKNFCEL